MRKPSGFVLSIPEAKKNKGLAIRDTLHGSRPSLDDSDRRVRVVPTPLAFRLKFAYEVLCPKTEKNTYNYSYICYE